MSPIPRWHPGKLILLWAWGVLAAGLVLTDFMRRTQASTLVLQLFELVFVLLLLLVLSAITWTWLGGRESHSVEDDPTNPQ